LGYSLVFDRRTPDSSWQNLPGFAESVKYPAGEDHPVGNVSWYDAWAYCNWAGRRLPTEAEWEAAARGTDQRRFPWGNTLPDGSQANLTNQHLHSDQDSFEVEDGYTWTAPVGTYPGGASPSGALDMAGNLWEYVYDFYQPEVQPETASNLVNLEGSENRVARGGSFDSDLVDARTGNRIGVEPQISRMDFGFRCVESARELPDPPEVDSLIPDLILEEGKADVYIFPGYFQIATITDQTELQILGQYNQCRYIKFQTASGNQGWVQITNNVRLNIPCGAIPELSVQPLSGTLGAGGWGIGELRVTNLGDQDAVVVLEFMDQDRRGFWTYARAGERVIRTDIPDGQYQVYFTTGSDWDPELNRFRESDSYQMMERTLTFSSSASRYSIWELDLHSDSGDTGSQAVSESEFPD
jgi:hypothetical protein